MSFFSKFFLKTGSTSSPQAVAVTLAPEVAKEGVELTPYIRLKNQANQLLDEGELIHAESIYRLALQENPSLSEAHLNLGYVLNELSRADEAIHYIEQAILLDPQNFDGHFLRAILALNDENLDLAIRHAEHAFGLNALSKEAESLLYKSYAIKGDYSKIEDHIRHLSDSGVDETALNVRIAKIITAIPVSGDTKKNLMDLAAAHLQQAAKLSPRDAHVFFSQGLLNLALNQSVAAIKCFENTVRLKPSHAGAYFYLGQIQKTSGQFLKAHDMAGKAISFQPDYAEAHKLLGDLYYESGQFKNAAACYQRALDSNADFADALAMLGMVQYDLGQLDTAIESCRQAVALRPESPEMYFGLANVFTRQHKYSQAIEVYRQALRLRPSYIDAQINLGAAQLGSGNYMAALETYRAVVEAEPDHLTANSNIAYCLSFDDSCSPSDYLKSARQFGKVSSSKARAFTSWKFNTLPDQCLKVGLVSGDLGMHPVGFFLESVIAYIDSEKIELHAFSNGSNSEDTLQASLKSRFTSWTSIVGVSDEAAAKLIHDAQLDLLIDLSGHTGKNRLSVFSWRPAPVQVTWLGYWASTGVPEIDYILADPHSVPAENRVQFSEQVWYLPDSRLCFTPPSAIYDLPVSAPPAVKNGYVTFGCFQPVRKLTPKVLELWGEIFQQLPHTRLRLQGAGFTDPETGLSLLKRLENVGISRDRVTLHGAMLRLSYLKAHAEVDIILDSFPYPGGTTTCDALWMGVPTVTLAGNTMLSRQGVSMMVCAALPDWVAKDRDAYISIAVSKAGSITELTELRKKLRQQVFESPLFNAPSFAKHFVQSLCDMARERKQLLYPAAIGNSE